eukprot:GDKJ01019292.1.p1 GENE.GDKJ01019292.1~~GDKJ01019292.1.p1  ORF type:complete len:343 (-),score=59.21 GDKJ01019292.1:276-1304(-)
MSHKMFVRKQAPFDKKIPENPAYKSVTAKVNSNNTKVTFVPEKVIVKRREEIFTRISARGLIGEIENIDITDESIYNMSSFDDCKSVVSSLNVESSQSDGSNLLILDIRSAEEYRLGHIKGAVSYTMQLLMRDKITPLLHRFRDTEGRIFVVYGNDDKSTAQAAETFVLKGWPGVFCLSGGFETFAAVSEGDYVVGQRPAAPAETVSVIHGGGAIVRGPMGTSCSSIPGARLTSMPSSCGRNIQNMPSGIIGESKQRMITNAINKDSVPVAAPTGMKSSNNLSDFNGVKPLSSRASSVATARPYSNQSLTGGRPSGTRLAWAGAAALTTSKPGLGGSSKRFS